MASRQQKCTFTAQQMSPVRRSPRQGGGLRGRMTAGSSGESRDAQSARPQGGAARLVFVCPDADKISSRTGPCHWLKAWAQATVLPASASIIHPDKLLLHSDPPFETESRKARRFRDRTRFQAILPPLVSSSSSEYGGCVPQHQRGGRRTPAAGWEKSLLFHFFLRCELFLLEARGNTSKVEGILLSASD